MRFSDRAGSGAGLFLPEPQRAERGLVVEMEEAGSVMMASFLP
jgi:hypothetical protein